MALGLFTVTRGRVSVTDPVTVMHDQTVIALRRTTGQTARGWTFFLRPFHPLVYALIGGCLLSVLVLLLLLETCQRAYRAPQRALADTGLQRVAVVVEIVVSALLNKCGWRDDCV